MIAEPLVSQALKYREARSRIAALKSDFSRWCRTCYRIKTEAGNIIPLVLNPPQLKIRRIEEEQLTAHGRARKYILKARQAGITTEEQAANLEECWSHQGRDCITLAEKLDKTTKIFEITRRAIDHFPKSLLPQMGQAATHEITFVQRDSHFWTGTAGTVIGGHGVTIARLHLSEFAFYEEPLVLLNGFRPAMEKVPNSVITIETTPSEFDSEAHGFWKEAVSGKNGFVPIFFPWWECDPRYSLPLLAPDELGKLEDAEAALHSRHGVSLEQIKWRREKIREYGTESAFFQQYPEDDETCWMTGGSLFYESKLLRDLFLKAPTPISTEMDGALEIFGELQKGERAIFGADTAEGGGGDRSAFVARAFPSWRLLAVFQDNRIQPRDFASVLNTQGRRFGGSMRHAFLIVEKNAHGITVLRDLRDVHHYPTIRMYHRLPLDKATEGTSERIGWATTGESQPLLLDAGTDLLAACNDGLAEIPCLAGLRDAFGVKRDDSGRVKLTGKDVWVSECLAWIGRRVPQGSLIR